jgi:hypothetical protein
MFFDDSLKDLKRELKAVGADLSYVKKWQKNYDKVKKSYPILENQYIKAKADLNAVMKCLKEMEQMMISATVNSDIRSIRERMNHCAKEMKKYQKGFNHEFLIGKEDKEFHLTFSTILSLCEKDMKEKRERLILQSEVENMMSITKEALEKVWPEFRELAYFYIEHTDKELSELPHQEKIQLVRKLYKEEYYDPMKKVLVAALGAERADKIMEDEL